MTRSEAPGVDYEDIAQSMLWKDESLPVPLGVGSGLGLCLNHFSSRAVRAFYAGKLLLKVYSLCVRKEFICHLISCYNIDCGVSF